MAGQISNGKGPFTSRWNYAPDAIAVSPLLWPLDPVQIAAGCCRNGWYHRTVNFILIALLMVLVGPPLDQMASMSHWVALLYIRNMVLRFLKLAV